MWIDRVACLTVHLSVCCQQAWFQSFSIGCWFNWHLSGEAVTAPTTTPKLRETVKTVGGVVLMGFGFSLRKCLLCWGMCVCAQCMHASRERVKDCAFQWWLLWAGRRRPGKKKNLHSLHFCHSWLRPRVLDTEIRLSFSSFPFVCVCVRGIKIRKIRFWLNEKHQPIVGLCLQAKLPSSATIAAACWSTCSPQLWLWRCNGESVTVLPVSWATVCELRVELCCQSGEQPARVWSASRALSTRPLFPHSSRHFWLLLLLEINGLDHLESQNLHSFVDNLLISKRKSCLW